MNQQSTHSQSSQPKEWKTKFLIGGGLLGGVVGVATAYLVVRTAEETDNSPLHVSTSDALRVSVGVIGTIRAIVALAKRKDGK
jgi:hypothetical protein